MNMKKIFVLIIAVVIVAASVATALAVVTQNANKAGNPGTPTNNPAGTGLSIDQAATAAQTYLTKMGYSNLGVKTMQEYTNMYYAQVIETNNGTGAFELAVDKTTGAVTPMQGPTLMWDTKYGAASTGMMGYLTGTSSSGSGMMGGTAA